MAQTVIQGKNMPGWRPEELALGIEPEDAECEGMPYGVFTLSGTTPVCPINPHCGVRVGNKRVSTGRNGSGMMAHWRIQPHQWPPWQTTKGGSWH